LRSENNKNISKQPEKNILHATDRYSSPHSSRVETACYARKDQTDGSFLCLLDQRRSRLAFGEYFVRKQLIVLFFNCIGITTLAAFEQNVHEKCGLAGKT
jgi:hypothetical protein